MRLIDYSDEYDRWFDTLDEDSQIAVLRRVELLKEYGPNLPRPYSDVLHGAKRKNLKELRAQTRRHILRIAYYFDPQRNAYLLTGGDKKGKGETAFYAELIRLSEQIIVRHEKEDLKK